MGLTVGELSIELDARTDEFRAGLRRAESRLDRFGGQTTTRTRGIARSFAALGVGIGAVTVAIGALGGAIAAVGFGRFVSAGVQSAAAFEQIAISLEVLTGNAEGAARVLEDVNRLVVETPFGLQEVASAARSVAVVFGENTEAVSEFTAIAADLAAAFGRPVEQIGENLSRAFSAGIGAADVFREAGITAEILRISGATDVAAISGEQLADALRQITAEGGKAFGAAAAQAESLGGALSNTVIGFQNFQRAFGEALSPVIVDVLLQVQQGFQLLEQAVRDNSDRIAELARNAIPVLAAGLRNAGAAIAFLIRAFGFLVNSFRALRFSLARLQLGFVRILAVIRSIPIGLQSIVRVGEGVFAALARAVTGDFGGALKAVTEEVDLSDLNAELQGLQREVDAAKDVSDEAFQTFVEGSAAIDALADGVARGTDTIADFADGTRTAKDATDDLTESTEENTRADLSNIAALNRLTATQLRAAESLRRINLELDRAGTGRTDELTEQANKLDDQITKVRGLAVASGDEQSRLDTILRLETERDDILQRRADLQQTNLDLETRVQDQIARIAQVDPARAAALTAQLGQALADTFGDPTAREAAINALAVGITEEIPPALSAALSTGVTMGLRDGVDAADIPGALSGFADVFEARFQQGVTNAFTEAVDTFDRLLTAALDKAGDAIGGLFEEGGLFAGVGGFLEGAGIDAGEALSGAIGLGVAAFRAATAEDDITTAAAGVQSAVTSAERVRGIVAGPTSIAVAQVDRAIGDAFVETNLILRRIESNTRATASNSSAEGGGSVTPSSPESEATRILVGQSETLL